MMTEQNGSELIDLPLDRVLSDEVAISDEDWAKVEARIAEDDKTRAIMAKVREAILEFDRTHPTLAHLLDPIREAMR